MGEFCSPAAKRALMAAMIVIVLTATIVFVLYSVTPGGFKDMFSILGILATITIGGGLAAILMIGAGVASLRCVTNKAPQHDLKQKITIHDNRRNNAEQKRKDDDRKRLTAEKKRKDAEQKRLTVELDKLKKTKQKRKDDERDRLVAERDILADELAALETDKAEVEQQQLPETKQALRNIEALITGNLDTHEKLQNQIDALK